MDAGWTLTLPPALHARLWQHLFPGDGQEHGAVLLAGVHGPGGGLRLLGRELLLAQDGVDYVPGQYGHRALTADFVQRAAVRARNDRLAYLAVHCHGGQERVAFSPTDLASHERGYPALRDITRQPVGALVAAEGALAGDLWLPDGGRGDLVGAVVPGNRITRLYPSPPPAPDRVDSGWDRQVRLLGNRGQGLLAATTVAIVGLGGVGSILAEMMGRLGVGTVILIDPDRIDSTNLSRLIAARRSDARHVLRGERAPRAARRLGGRLATPKVKAAARNVRRANRHAVIHPYAADVAGAEAATALLTADFIFLAADSNTARHVVNAVVQQYLIPGVQAGVKVSPDGGTGVIRDVHVAVRPLTPGQGCLWCAGLIDPSELAIEALPETERRAARYIPEVPSPSVITLNGIAAAEAATYFLFAHTGLTASDGPTEALLRFPRDARLYGQTVHQRAACRWCAANPGSHLARGDAAALPVRTGLPR